MLDYFVVPLLRLLMVIGKCLISFYFVIVAFGTVMFHCMCLVIFDSCFYAFVGGQATQRQAVWTWNITNGEL